VLHLDMKSYFEPRVAFAINVSNRLIAKSLPRTVIVRDRFSLDQDSNFNIRITIDTHCVSQILPMALGLRGSGGGFYIIEI